jgi:hypothetical protein
VLRPAVDFQSLEEVLVVVSGQPVKETGAAADTPNQEHE